MPENKNYFKKPVYKSPPSKLVAFFKESRDNWKQKFKGAKRNVKRLTEQVRYWKRQTDDLRRRVKELEEELEKSEKNSEECETPAVKFGEIPAFHKYSYGHMHLFLRLVLEASVSMRGASRSLDIVSSFLELGIEMPSWSAGRLWLLRIGLYKIERPRTIADDWIWIIDHTVQLGNEKCMVILGVRESSLPDCELHLKHEDVEPLALFPVEKSNGEVVFQQLEETIEKTGVPKQIVMDHGPDVKSGAEKFCEKYGIMDAYDIKHKGANILKRELKDVSDWENFSTQAGKTSKKVQQTKFADMAPPYQRSKARYMNLDKLVKWGAKTLVRLDIEKRELGNEFESCEMKNKFGWVYEYREQLQNWKSLVDIVDTAVCFVNFTGLYKGMDVDLRDQLDELPCHPRFAGVKDELVEFAQAQQSSLGDGDRLLGSSEIIESVFGKYKRLQDDQIKGGFTGMLLGLAASVSDLNVETVKNAIDSIPTKKVWRWIQDNVGKSVHARRKEFNKIVKKEEQKLAEFSCAV